MGQYKSIKNKAKGQPKYKRIKEKSIGTKSVSKTCIVSRLLYSSLQDIVSPSGYCIDEGRFRHGVRITISYGYTIIVICPEIRSRRASTN